MKYIGVDLGGHFIKAVLMDSKNQILKKVKIETARTQKQNIENIIYLIDQLKTKDTKAVGIGVPGIIENNKIIKLPNFKEWKNVKLKDIIQKKTRLKTTLEKDTNCALLAESKNRKYKNIVMISIGTGLGCAIMINNQLYKGKGNAGELAHNIQNKKEIEDLVSAKAIQKLGRTKDIIALEKTRKGKIIYKAIAKQLSITLTNLTNILDPEAIIIGGGVGKSKLIRNNIKLNPVHKKPKILESKHGYYAGAIGAAQLNL